jgi:hypothetical protein
VTDTVSGVAAWSVRAQTEKSYRFPFSTRIPEL